MKQLERNIARLIALNPEKVNQLDKLQDLCLYYTSDDDVTIRSELYHDDIVRYIITGTRCIMTITAHSKTGELVRKPRGEDPWAYTEDYSNCGDILHLAMELSKYENLRDAC